MKSEIPEDEEAKVIIKADLPKASSISEELCRHKREMMDKVKRASFFLGTIQRVGNKKT